MEEGNKIVSALSEVARYNYDTLNARIKELEEQNISLQFSLQCEATDRLELLEVLNRAKKE